MTDLLDGLPDDERDGVEETAVTRNRKDHSATWFEIRDALEDHPSAQAFMNRLQSKHGKGKALSILAAELGRATYFMLKRNQALDMERFLTN